jgi:hypothetical protein
MSAPIEILAVVTLIPRNANEAVVVPMVLSGRICVWRESGVKLSVCVGIFFAINFLKKKFYKLFTFSAIYKDNAAVIFIAVQHKTFNSRQL